MLGLDIPLQIKNVVKVVNVKGYTETCPLAWCPHWTIFFRSSRVCFVNCSMLMCTVIDAIERLRGFGSQNKLLFWMLLIYFWYSIRADFFGRASFNLTRKGGKRQIILFVIGGKDLTWWHSFHCLLQLPVVKHTSISKALRTIFPFWSHGCGPFCK